MAFLMRKLRKKSSESQSRRNQGSSKFGLPKVGRGKSKRTQRNRREGLVAGLSCWDGLLAGPGVIIAFERQVLR